MLNNKTVAVVVPCFNEEKQIGGVLGTMPDFVDLIIVVNDQSKDATLQKVKGFIANDTRGARSFEKRVKSYSNGIYAGADNVALDIEKETEKLFIPYEVASGMASRVILLTHSRNGGKGASVATGYKYALDHALDCTAIMDGDGQMNPAELERVCTPIVTGQADYSKGNRFKHRNARQYMPPIRFYGNAILSILTKIATGYWRVSDTQTGFTAISLEVLENMEIHNLYPSYGVYNDILQKLNLANFTITEVPIAPVYNIGEKSKMNIFKVVPTISGLLIRRFFERLFIKYLFESFHPLFLLYMISFLTFLIDIPIIIQFLYAFVESGVIWSAHLTVLTSLLIFSFQSLVFAMWFDMHDNERLYI